MEQVQKTVLIVTAPELPAKSLRELRDYVIESVQMGVLVLSSRYTYKLDTMPELGGVEVMGGNLYSGEYLIGVDLAEEGTEDQMAEVPPLRAHDAPVKYAGRAGEEKRRIFQRLQKYREKHGKGCLDAVAERAGREISADVLRELLIGGMTISIDHWRRIDKALDVLEKLPTSQEASNG